MKTKRLGFSPYTTKWALPGNQQLHELSCCRVFESLRDRRQEARLNGQRALKKALKPLTTERIHAMFMETFKQPAPIQKLINQKVAGIGRTVPPREGAPT